ncbi:MAG: MBL fold metallo-hydrolase, partial [Lachnospiraceae bacterium]|nr:MBL fold metallo-hydrolase [Lachnospiraceae bacterium]
MKICSLASGSSGNCIYISDGDSHILVDAGISRKRIVDGLKELNVTPDMLSGIFITHEHSDHIKGIEMMEKYFNVPLYATNGTFRGVNKSCKGKLDRDNLNVIQADTLINIGGLSITPFEISHDANEPVGFTVVSENKKCSIATDLGKYDDYILNHLKGSEMLYVEANYDVSMIETG